MEENNLQLKHVFCNIEHNQKRITIQINKRTDKTEQEKTNA